VSGAPLLSNSARTTLRRLVDLLARTALVPHLTAFGKYAVGDTTRSLSALLHVTRALVESISAVEVWSEISAVLSDLLAALVHVMSLQHVTDEHVTEDDVTRVKQWAARQLDHVIEHVPVTELAEQCFVLLKLASNQSAPAHVPRQLGIILSRLLLRPGGLFGVLTPILTAKNGNVVCAAPH
jgi:hypothetical protein